MFRRSGQREDRRRRALAEDANTGTTRRDTAHSRASDDSANGPRYAEEASPERHLRISRLIPTKLWGFAVMLLLGTGTIAGLLALHHNLLGELATESSAIAAIFDLSASGSLATWSGTLMLAVASATSLLVLSLRRHKLSDYHGRYRVWLWASAALMTMSVATTAPLHLLLADYLATLTEWQLPGGTMTFWLAPAVLVLGGLGVRLLIDLRDSRLATTGLILAILAYGTATGMRFTMADGVIDPTAVMILTGSQMSGHLLVLLSVMLFARHVLLDIQGLVKVREIREKKKKPKATSDEAKKEKTSAAKKLGKKIDSAHTSPPQPAGRSDLEPKPTSRPAKRQEQFTDEYEDEYESRGNKRNQKAQGRSKQQFDDYEDEPQDQGRKMSKSERKRLRKLKSQQQERL